MSPEDPRKDAEAERAAPKPPEERPPEATNQVQATPPAKPAAPLFRIVRADPKNTLNFEDVADK